mmetsp:Transcript_11595/g.24184  ORF Transcript_11595/g.24184 Transcript_11595/m.24184 type:complete len:303 (+) Transcript_11595:111-1019(+)
MAMMRVLATSQYQFNIQHKQKYTTHGWNIAIRWIPQNCQIFCWMLLLRFSLLIINLNERSIGLHLLQSFLLLLVVSSTWSHTLQVIHLSLPFQDLFCLLNKVSSHLHLTNNGDGAAKLLMHHEAKDAHLSRPAVVQLDGALVPLPLLSLLVPSEVKLASVAEVADVLSEAEGVTVDRLHHGDGESHLEVDLGGKGIEGLEASRNVLSTRESDTSGSDQVPDNRKHGNAAVLQLDVTEAIEVGLVAVGAEAKGIEESKGGLGADLIGKRRRLQGSGRGGALGGGREGGSADEDGGEDGGLHFP